MVQVKVEDPESIHIFIQAYGKFWKDSHKRIDVLQSPLAVITWFCCSHGTPNFWVVLAKFSAMEVLNNLSFLGDISFICSQGCVNEEANFVNSD